MLKTFRDIRETIGSFISILVVIFIGCFFFSGIMQGSASITDQVYDYNDACNLASARATYMYVNSAAVDEIAKTDGVSDAYGYDTFYTDTTSFDGHFDMTVTTLSPGIDDPFTVRGRKPAPGAHEMMIDEVFADAHGVKLGDRVEFEISAMERIVVSISDGVAKYTPEYAPISYTFTVCGIYHSPDIIYKVNMMNTSEATSEFVMAFVEYGEIRSYTDSAAVYFEGVEQPVFKYSSVPQDVKIYNGIRITGDLESEEYEDIFKKYSVASREQLTDVFKNPERAAGLYMYYMDRDSFPAISAFDSINDTIAALAAVLPLLFFAVAAAITVISLSKTVESQRMQIGVIRAIGVGKGSVYFSYIFYALFASLIGGIAGGVVGSFFIPYLLEIVYERQFRMPPTDWHIGVIYLFLSVIISAALACLSAFVSCHRTLKQVPAQAMRPKPPKKTKRILAERWTGLWKRLGFGAKMNLRNMFLHKMRMLLSSVGIIGCIALLVGLLGVKDNMSHSFDGYRASTGYDMTIVTGVAVDISPESEIYDLIAGADEQAYMHNLTFVPDFSGRFEFKGKTADLTVMAIPTYADEKFYRYADADCVKLFTDLDSKDRVLFESDTFVIPESLAEKLGAKKGDTVRVSGYSLDNKPIEFDIRVTDVVCEYFDQKAYCSYDVFIDNGVALVADTSYATLLPGKDMAAAVKLLESNEFVRAAQTFGETYDALDNQMSLLDYAVIIFVVGAAALAVAVIYNITATNLKERTREIATLMVLGYKRNETANMIIVENMVITAIGCILGLPLGYGLLLWIIGITKSFNVYISDVLTWYVAIGCIAMTFLFSLIATMFLNRKMKHISMVEALKSVE